MFYILNDGVESKSIEYKHQFAIDTWIFRLSNHIFKVCKETWFWLNCWLLLFCFSQSVLWLDCHTENPLDLFHSYCSFIFSVFLFSSHFLRSFLSRFPSFLHICPHTVYSTLICSNRANAHSSQFEPLFIYPYDSRRTESVREYYKNTLLHTHTCRNVFRILNQGQTDQWL